MAAAEERGHQEYQEPSEHTRLEWRVGSTPSSERRRNRVRHYGRSVHTSELFGRHRDRSSREHSPREELNQPAPSTVPFGSPTREELRLHQPVSIEEPNPSASSLDIYGSMTTEEVQFRQPLSRPLSSGSSTGEKATEH